MAKEVFLGSLLMVQLYGNPLIRRKIMDDDETHYGQGGVCESHGSISFCWRWAYCSARMLAIQVGQFYSLITHKWDNFAYGFTRGEQQAEFELYAKLAEQVCQ